jgi:hypothetical protein
MAVHSEGLNLNQIKIMEERLSDGSLVYSVMIGSMEINCIDFNSADQLFTLIDNQNYSFDGS